MTEQDDTLDVLLAEHGKRITEMLRRNGDAASHNDEDVGLDVSLDERAKRLQEQIERDDREMSARLDALISRSEKRARSVLPLALDSAQELERLITSNSAYFTGEPPYVGLEGLALALKQDYAELDQLRVENERLRYELKEAHKE